MSRISNRIATIGATVAIIFLVILLIVLWSDVHNVDKIGNLSQMRKNLSINNSIDETQQEQISGSRVAKTDLVTSIESIEQNYTNEVLSESTQKSTKNSNDTSSINILSYTKDNLEYIKPLKISQNQYEDPPEEHSTAKRHHSGHFRHTSAEVWDPHPQYEFTAFGRRFRLRLAHDASFVSPDIKVTHMSENITNREKTDHHLGCFYSGSVDGDPNSAVSVSLCHGMKKIKNDGTYNPDNARVENEKLYKSVNRDSIETKYLREKIQQLEAELKKKDEALSFASNQQVEHLERLLEKKIIEFEDRLEKNLEKKIKDVVDESVMINQLDQKISNIENIMSTSPATNAQKVLDWINSLPE